MKLILLLSVICLSGCYPHTADIDISGHNLETPYGKIEDGHIVVHSNWGKCDVITNTVNK